MEQDVRFEVVVVVKMAILFWVVTLCVGRLGVPCGGEWLASRSVRITLRLGFHRQFSWRQDGPTEPAWTWSQKQNTRNAARRFKHPLDRKLVPQSWTGHDTQEIKSLLAPGVLSRRSQSLY